MNQDKSWAELVAEFNTVNDGLAPPKTPVMLLLDSFKVQRLRLMMEELGELSEAIHQNDTVEIADAIADLLYVVVGTANTYGLTSRLDAIFREVHRSNMTKTFSGSADGQKGGFKGPGFEKPNIRGILSDGRFDD
jgi:hypothetical protein